MKNSPQKLLVSSMIVIVSFAQPLQAVDLYWDPDTFTPGAQDGAGTWDTAANLFWFDGANNILWDNATPANAIFGTNNGTAGAVTIAAGTTINIGNLTVNPSSSGNYNFTPGDASSRLSFSPDSVVTIGAGLAVTNTVIFTGSSSFTKAGPGTYSIRPASPNLHSGTTIVTAGTLVMGSSGNRVVVPGDLIITNTGNGRLGAANTIANASTISVATGASLEMNGNSLSVTNFVLNGGTVFQSGTETLTVQTYDARGGAMNQSGGSGKMDVGTLTKSTTGTVTLTTRGSSAAGGGLTNTVVNDGTLILDYVQGSSKLYDSGSLTINGGFLVLTNGTTTETVGAVTITGGVITNGGGTSKFSVPSGTYDLQAGSIYTVLAGAAGLAKTTPATAILAAAHTYSGGTTVSDGILQLGDGNTSGTLAGGITDNAQIVFNPGPAGASFANIITGSGTITKVGGGTITLTGANSYQGSTTISNGLISVNGSSTLGDGSGALNLSGGTLNSTVSRTPSTAPIANPLNLTADSAVTTTSAASTVDMNFANDSIAGTAGTLMFSNAAPSGTGVFQPRFSGSGFNFVRPIVIANGNFGATRLDSFNTLGTTQTFSANISGTGGYRRTASVSGNGGTTVFLGTNTFIGNTDVNQGTLLVNGVLGNSAVTVAANGTLGGVGRISGAVMMNGVLSPGNSIGTLTVSNILMLQAGSTTSIEINKSLTTNDMVRGISTLTYGGTLNVVNLSGTLALNDSFKIFEAASYLSSFTASNLPALDSGLAWDLSGLASNGTIKVVAAGVAAPLLSFTQTGSILQFIWSGSFKLQAQTNNLSLGLGTNWVDYPGGDTSPVLVTNYPGNPAVFFRLAAP